MSKLKIIILLLVILILAAGGFFWWQNQAAKEAVEGLNKDLPEGVRVERSLFGEEYKVVNEIDGYEFTVPQEWKGLEEIEYIPEREVGGYVGTTISIEGEKGIGSVVGIDFYKSGGDLSAGIEVWAKSNFETFGLVGEFTKDRLKNFNIVKTEENVHLGGDHIYFFEKNKIVYAITSPSEEFIEEIILNGNW